MRLRRLPRRHPGRVGLVAPAIRGFDLAGRPVSVEPGQGKTVLLFLTSSCRPCRAVWDVLGELDGNPPGSPVVAAVTPDRQTEDPRALAELVPFGLTLLMSTQGWVDCGVTGAPWAVVAVDGVVRSDGPAPADRASLHALLS